MSHGTRPRIGASSRRLIAGSSDPIERFGAHVTPQPNGCLAWNGDLTKYGRFDGTNAHRWIWEATRGRIRDGAHIHHTCGNPGCVNPQHLRVLSPKRHRATHAALMPVVRERR